MIYSKKAKMKKVLGIVLAVVLSLTCILLCSSCKLIRLKSAFNTVKYKDESKYSIGNFTFQSSEIDKIEINWIFGDITIVESDKAELSVTEDESGLKNNQKLRYLIEGRTLKIQFWKAYYKSNLSNRKKNLTIEIPQNIALEINQVSGNIESDKLTLRSLDIEIVSGNTNIDSLKTGELNIDTVSGRVNINSVNATYIEVDTVSGNVKMGLFSATEVEINSVSGDVSLKLNGLGATIDFNSVSGHYRNEAKYGDGSCSIEVDTTSGDLHVEN